MLTFCAKDAQGGAEKARVVTMKSEGGPEECCDKNTRLNAHENKHYFWWASRISKSSGCMLFCTYNAH